MRYSRLFCLAILGLIFFPKAITLPAQAPPLEGTYTGVLQAGDAELHIVLHLSRNSVGALHATLDSLENSVFAVEASAASVNAGTLRFEVHAVGVRYEGRVSTDQKTIEGNWSQGNASLPLVFHREPAPHLPEGSKFGVEGLWQGALEAHGLRLRFQLHVSHDQKGELIAALDSLDQFVSGLPAAKVSQKESAFHFEIPALSSTYDGTLAATKSSMTGEWSQSEIKEKLEFNRSDQPLELRRPQNPSKPYPYNEEEVAFSNAKAGVNLAGTLSVPNGTGPFAAAILIAGSGPQDRDGTIANHKPFLVLSDYLTRKGIAVLRYDKRGVGQSTGSAEMATTMDLAGDAECAIAYLKSRKDIDAGKIGLIGHSEGAMIAPAIAAGSHDVSWVVLLAAPSTKGEDTLLNQSDLIARTGGLSDAQVLASLNFDKQAYDLLQKEQDSAVVDGEAQGVGERKRDGHRLAATGSGSAASPDDVAVVPLLSCRMIRSPTLKKTKCPVLALYGEKDLQVPPKINLPIFRRRLRTAGTARRTCGSCLNSTIFSSMPTTGLPPSTPRSTRHFLPRRCKLSASGYRRGPRPIRRCSAVLAF